MDRVDKKILQNIYSDDVIFHYTKAASAIDYILYQKELRFSHRKKSNDPIENKIFHLTNVSTDGLVAATKENNKKIEDNSTRANNIYNSLKKRANSYHQICFCCNALKKSFFSNFLRQAEEFGFTKPRMWEQYADNYKGVCIAFSKEKILEKNKGIHLIEDNISYTTYSELKKKNKTINILKVTEEVYEKQLEATQDRELFLKHQDYSGENEYRINILKEIDDHYDKFLNITDCIVAVIISVKANNRQRKALMEYANELGVPHFNIIWNDNGIEIVNDEYYSRQLADLRKRI